MSKRISLSIENPCTEQWSNFTPTANGGFCSSCSKNVVDFTTMSDAQILSFFTNKPANTCGRLRSDQLRTYSLQAVPTLNPGFTLLKAGFLSLLFALVAGESSASVIPQHTSAVYMEDTASILTEESRAGDEERIVKGIVRDDTNTPMAGVSIYLKGSTEGTVTDADGKFEFPRKLKEGDVLMLNFIGYKTMEYTITAETVDSIEIVMSAAYYEMMGTIIVVDDIYTKKEQSGLRRWWGKVKDIF